MVLQVVLVVRAVYPICNTFIIFVNDRSVFRSLIHLWHKKKLDTWMHSNDHCSLCLII